jgi:hypothetical protein
MHGHPNIKFLVRYLQNPIFYSSRLILKRSRLKKNISLLRRTRVLEDSSKISEMVINQHPFDFLHIQKYVFRKFPSILVAFILPFCPKSVTTSRSQCVFVNLCTSDIYIYTGCPRRNGQNFGRVFRMLKYNYITQNTYIQSWTVTEIMAREKCGLLVGPRTVHVNWQVLSMFVRECGVILP